MKLKIKVNSFGKKNLPLELQYSTVYSTPSTWAAIFAYKHGVDYNFMVSNFETKHDDVNSTLFLTYKNNGLVEDKQKLEGCDLVLTISDGIEENFFLGVIESVGCPDTED